MDTNIPELVMAQLAAHGWKADSILTEVAIKNYGTPSDAVSRLSFEKAFSRFWLKGEYTSAGEDVLSTCTVVIPLSASRSEVLAAVDKFETEATRRVENSFAGRFLRKPLKAGDKREETSGPRQKSPRAGTARSYV